MAIYRVKSNPHDYCDCKDHVCLTHDAYAEYRRSQPELFTGPGRSHDSCPCEPHDLPKKAPAKAPKKPSAAKKPAASGKGSAKKTSPEKASLGVDLDVGLSADV